MKSRRDQCDNGASKGAALEIDISVVVPVYKSEGTLRSLVKRLSDTFARLGVTSELVLVDDCSPDNGWNTMLALVKEKAHPHLRIFRLSRNFGQHYAISAGLDQTRGRWVVVMDCDLQDQPEEIEKLYKKAIEGYDIVLGSRRVRNDDLFKKISSRSFYWVLSRLTGVKHDPNIANYGIYSAQVVQAMRGFREQIRYFPVMVRWVGFKSTNVEIQHAERAIGETSYTFGKLFDLAIQVILAHSDRPLRLTMTLGLLLSLGSLFLAGLYFVMALAGKIVVAGWASVIISLFFLSGVIIFVLGIMALYLGKVFEQVKQRPLYIISESSETLNANP